MAISISYTDATCQDGCGAETAKGRRFKQGHDARLKSQLFKAIRSGDGALKVNGKATTAEAVLKANGWPQPAPKKAKPKRPASKTAKRTAAKRTTRKAKSAA